MPEKKENAQVDTNSNLDIDVLSLNAMRENAESALRKDEWKQFDTAIVEVVQDRLVAASDLISAGLTRNLGGLGTVVDEWENVTDMTGAEADMSGVAEGQRDTIGYEPQGVPIPIIHKDYQLNLRRLEASRKLGQALDTTVAEVAARKVAELVEDMIFYGLSIKSAGYQIYGYTNFPARKTGTITAAWTTATAAQIVADVEAMLSAADVLGYHGGFNLYVPNAYYAALRSDYNTTSGKTIMQRLSQYPEILSIKAADRISGAEIVMVKMSREVVDLSIGADIQNVEWDSHGKFMKNFKVFNALAPRLKKSYDGTVNGKTGIFHWSV